MGKARRSEFSTSIDGLKVHARGGEVIPDLLGDRSTGVALEEGCGDEVELSKRRRLTTKVILVTIFHAWSHGQLESSSSTRIRISSGIASVG